ncbi:hypothetical protein IFM89_021862 [Coptis chinensis]|uniref:Non-specific serine/threonine protein kinase n=1 Tax=Coptis chinensis TaxID=261450 RepID=A0A835HG67_9MAGN|nr:hypothetical protein IFM89_021862 [Coptis chinensis]
MVWKTQSLGGLQEPPHYIAEFSTFPRDTGAFHPILDTVVFRNITSPVSLDLSDNYISRVQYPESFANLTNLHYFGLMYNEMSGSVPNVIADLPVIDTFLVWNNYFSSTTATWEKNSKLKYVDVSTNGFTEYSARYLCRGCQGREIKRPTLKKKAKKIRYLGYLSSSKDFEKARDPKYPQIGATPRNKLDHYQILKYLLTTESAMKKIEDNNTLVFIVDIRTVI